MEGQAPDKGKEANRRQNVFWSEHLLQDADEGIARKELVDKQKVFKEFIQDSYFLVGVSFLQQVLHFLKVALIKDFERRK